jgi:hypothetical protein
VTLGDMKTNLVWKHKNKELKVPPFRKKLRYTGDRDYNPVKRIKSSFNH